MVNTNLDTTPLPPNNLVAKDPQSAELAGYVRTKTFGRDVRESIARSIELNSTRSKSAEILANETLNVANDLTDRFNQQIGALTEDSEVIDARGGKATLGARLDETEAQLAEKADKQQVNDRLALKRDKDNKIEPEDFSTDALALVTGTGSVDLNTIPQNNSVTNKKIHSSVRQLLNNTIIHGVDLEWENGSVNNKGNRVDNNTRIRTVLDIMIDKGVIALNDYDTYKLLVIEYDLDGIIRAYSDWVSSDYVVDEPSKVTVVISRIDESEITPTTTIQSQLTVYSTNILESGQNLFQGFTRRFTVDSEKIDTYNDYAESFYIPLKAGLKYTVIINGKHNRQVFDLSNSLAIGTPVSRLQFGNVTKSHMSFTFTNTENYKYLIVTLSFNLDFTGNIIVHNQDAITLDGNALIPARANSIENDYIKPHVITKDRLAFDIESTSAPAVDVYTKEPDGDKARATTAEVHQDYDSLIALNPTYASRNVLGVDAWGNELREYIFKTPDYNTYADNPRNQDPAIAKPKILITTGIHGDEKTPVLAYYKFLKDMTENKPLGKWNELREAVEFRIIPVATPSAYTGNKRLNDNGVNINRNFDANWSSREPESGSSAASELETQLIQTWLSTHSDALVYMDVHNTGFSAECVWISAKKGTTYENYIKDAFRRTINSLSQHWRSDYGFPEDVYLGYTGEFNFSGAQQYGDSLSIPSCIPEIAWDVSTHTSDTGAFGDIAYAMAREFVGNFVMKLSKEYID